MTIAKAMRLARDEGDFQAAIDVIPYARFLGLSLAEHGGQLTTTLNYSDILVGNPVLPALHGGTVGALLEIAGLFQLIWEMDAEHLPKAIDVSIDYLRAGRPLDTFASARITRQGRRIANIRAEAWQNSRDKPIATAQIHFLLT